MNEKTLNIKIKKNINWKILIIIVMIRIIVISPSDHNGEIHNVPSTAQV